MRVEELTFLRFIAAAIVVIYHFGREATGFSGVLTAGPEMVSFFFVLSGFVMGISYLGKEIRAASYWWARASRIVPVYLLALVLVVMALVLKGQSINSLSLVLNLSLMQSWIPPHPTSLNTPGWSLSVEVFFYLSFPFVLYLIKKHSVSAVRMTLISLFTWGLTQTITTTALSNGLYGGSYPRSHDLIYYFPLTHYCSFLLGISGAMLISSNNRFAVRNNAPPILFIATFLAIIFAINNKEILSSTTGLNYAYGSSLFAPLFLVFILSIALCRSKLTKLLSAPYLVLLGEASYSLYILQMPIHSIYKIYVSTILNLDPLQNFVAFLIFLTIISIVTYKLFERPANKFLRYSLPQLINLGNRRKSVTK